jgi:hypothetical protein
VSAENGRLWMNLFVRDQKSGGGSAERPFAFVYRFQQDCVLCDLIRKVEGPIRKRLAMNGRFPHGRTG